MASKLEQLRSMSVVVADTGDLEAVRRLKPQDCTTNPSLVLKAAQAEASKPIIAEALRWGRTQNAGKQALVSAVAERLAVSFGAEMAGIVPGVVSTEVNADLSFDTRKSIEKGRKIIADYQERGIGRERILVKIASTWEGIAAAKVLQAEGINCNLTLLFSMVQARAAAEANAFLISPFVGRILDWHVKAGTGPYTAETDPGVVSVRAIYNHYKTAGIPTVVMGASFRNTGELEALAGCDRLTISPDLLDALDQDQGLLTRRLSPETAEGQGPMPALSEPEFRFALNEDPMATEKLAEGVRKFAADLRTLEAMVHKLLD